MDYLGEVREVFTLAEEWEMAPRREHTGEPKTDREQQWESTYLFQKQCTQCVIFRILPAITEAEKEIRCWEGPSLSPCQLHLL